MKNDFVGNDFVNFQSLENAHESHEWRRMKLNGKAEI